MKVPASSVDAYKAADGWSDFENIVAIPSSSLTDGENYEKTSTENGVRVTYTREFKNDAWQALFLPFAMEYADWCDKGTVAELTDVDAEGNLIWRTLGEGSSTEAGKPYIFKPNATGSMTLDVAYTTLKSSSEEDKVTVTIGNYILSGTYSAKTGLGGAYALAGGVFKKDGTGTKTLNPYRIYLTVSSPMKAPIRNIIVGSDASNNENILPTEIDGLDVEESIDAPAINLHGQRVGDGYKGIVIVNGKKVLRK